MPVYVDLPRLFLCQIPDGGSAPSFLDEYSTWYDQTTGADEVDCGDVCNVDRLDTQTFSLWVKVEWGLETTTALFTKANAGTETGYMAWLDEGFVWFQMVDASSNYLLVNTLNAIRQDVWHHIAITLDGSGTAAGVSIYIDAIKQTLTTTFDDLADSTTDPEGLDIGYNGTYGYTLNGYVDEVAFWTSELAEADIDAIYNSGVPVDLSTTANLRLWLRMGDGDAYPTITDHSGNGYDGTMSGTMSGANFVAEVPDGWSPLNPLNQVFNITAEDVNVTGANIDQWNDHSGNGFNLVPIGVNKCVLNAPASLNSQPAALVTTDVYVSAVAGPFSAATSYGFFVVYNNYNAAFTYQAFWGATTFFALACSTTLTEMGIFDGSQRKLGPGTADNNPHSDVYDFDDPGNTVRLYRAGALLGSTTYGASRTLAASLRFFSGSSAAGYLQNCDVACFLIVAGRPQTKDIARWAAWSLAKYGV